MRMLRLIGPFWFLLALVPHAAEAVSYQSFRNALDSGADCKELFTIRNSFTPKATELKRINEDLRDVGCFSASSHRKKAGEDKGFDYITCARGCDKQDPSQGAIWEACIRKCQSQL